MLARLRAETKLGKRRLRVLSSGAFSDDDYPSFLPTLINLEAASVPLTCGSPTYCDQQS